MNADQPSIQYRSRIDEIGHVTADPSVLFHYAGTSDGKSQAETYLESTFDAASCVFVARHRKLEQFLQKQLLDAGMKVQETEKDFEAFCRAPDSAELAKPEMPAAVGRIQILRVVGMVVLTVLGTVSFMALLQNSGEALADSRWKPLGIALSANLLLATGVKCLIECLPHGCWQNASARLICVMGLAAGFGALVGNAHLYAPLSPDEEQSLIEKTLGSGSGLLAATGDYFNAGWTEGPPDRNDVDHAEPDSFDPADWDAPADNFLSSSESARISPVPGTKDRVDAFWSTKTGLKVMITTVTAEACMAAVLAFFWSRTRREYRNVALSKLAGFKERRQARDEAVQDRDGLTEKLLAIQGSLEAVAAERRNFVEIGMARMTAFKG